MVLHVQITEFENSFQTFAFGLYRHFKVRGLEKSQTSHDLGEGGGGGAIESEVHVFKERASQLNTKKDTIQPENTKSEKSTENAPKL